MPILAEAVGGILQSTSVQVSLCSPRPRAIQEIGQQVLDPATAVWVRNGLARRRPTNRESEGASTATMRESTWILQTLGSTSPFTYPRLRRMRLIWAESSTLWEVKTSPLRTTKKWAPWRPRKMSMGWEEKYHKLHRMPTRATLKHWSTIQLSDWF